MNNIYTDVITYNNQVGRLVEYRRKDIDNISCNTYKFKPAGYGKYFSQSYDKLETIVHPESKVQIAGPNDGKIYAIEEFERYGRVKEYIAVNERYQIIVDAKTGIYHPHIKYKNIGRGFKDLKSAMLGMIVYDSVGHDDIHLNKYIFKLLDME